MIKRLKNQKANQTLRRFPVWGLLLAICVSPVFIENQSSVYADESKAVQKQTHASVLDKIVLEDGDTIVFLGDSITHQCLYTQYFENYIYTRFPGKRIRMHNAGVSGARAWDALQRFDEDVASYKPKYVTILLGMNDGRYEPFNKEHFETYQKDMAEVVNKIKAIGATPLIMTPTMFDARARRMNPRRKTDEPTVSQYNSVMAYYGAWMREVAARSGHGYVDMYGPLNQHTIEERKTNPQFTMIKDAIHPDPPGQVVMATAMVRDLGLPRQLSMIRITQNRQGKNIAKATGGKISDFQEKENSYEFTWHANSLPWVLPEEAQAGVVLTKMGHKLTREALQVSSLKPGQYQLVIDGIAVGTYSHVALGRGIELQGNAKTPQYQQAAKVAELNKKRNQEHVRGLRGIWSVFQRYARLQPDPEATEEEKAAFNKQKTAFAKRLVNMDQMVKEINAKAKEVEDEIFKVNQPVPRKYQLKQVSPQAKKQK